MSIQKRLALILAVSLVFILLVSFGLFEMTKAARFNQLNLLHQKYNATLEDVIQKSSGESSLPVAELRKTIENIRQQPIDCLKIINSFDRLVMKLIGTHVAYELCIEDDALAEKLLVDLDRYKKSEISREMMRQILVKANTKYNEISERFEEPVEKTVKFITRFVMISGAVTGAIALFALFFVSRGITQTVKTMEDTTRALEKSEEHNRKLAHIDTLTGLANRKQFQDRLEFMIKFNKHKKPDFWLLFIDLDHFKYINDTYGHSIGDELLKEAANRLTHTLRPCDTIARLGGDEFTVILNDETNNNSSHIAPLARRIISAIAEPFNINGIKTYTTASIGITGYPHDAENAVDLLKNADIAMYQAKSKGKNTYEFYSTDLRDHAQSRLSWEQNIREAIESNAFKLHYQPVIDHQKLNIAGAEALIRWDHPEMGPVRPDQFIGIAEETRLIIPIGEWVIAEAIRQCAHWRNNYSNKDLKIAVNVSVQQLKYSNFPKLVADTLSATGLPASALDLEITESVFLEDKNNCMDALFELDEIGAQLYLDDFGTGYSSFSYLNRLPFDVLKIDRSFIPTFQPGDKRTGTIASSITAMAHALDMKVVAEGIETIECFHYLHQQECDLAQGYLFSPAVPAESLNPDHIYSDLLIQEPSICDTA